MSNGKTLSSVMAFLYRSVPAHMDHDVNTKHWVD